MKGQKILIKNGLFVTVNSHMDIVQGDLLIENGRIIKLQSSPINVSDAEVLYADDFVIVPGFVQTHIHLAQTYFRNQAEDLSLLDWLSQKIWPGESNHTPETLLLSAQLSLAELIRSGTTTFMDIGIVNHAQVLFEAVAQSGLRAVLGKMLMDYGDGPAALIQKTDQALQESLDLLEKWNHYDNGRLRYAFNPRFVLSCSDILLKEIATLAKQKNVPVH